MNPAGPPHGPIHLPDHPDRVRDCGRRSASLHQLLAYLAIGWSLLLIPSWIYVLCSRDWYYKLCMWYRLQIGLFEVKFSKGILQSIGSIASEPVSPELSRSLDALVKRRFGVAEWREYVCSGAWSSWGGADVCQTMIAMQNCTWFLVFAIVCGLMGLSVMCVLIWQQYINRHAKKEQRLGLRVASCVAPFFFCLGTLIYMWAAEDFSTTWPPRMQHRGFGSNFGSSLIAAMVLSLASFVPMCIVIGGLGVSIEEIMPEGDQARKRRQDEETLFSALNYSHNDPFLSQPGVVSGYSAYGATNPPYNTAADPAFGYGAPPLGPPPPPTPFAPQGYGHGPPQFHGY